MIARNYFGDPFFIDVGEKTTNFPVYYAEHGAGRWDAVVVAPDIQHFSRILPALRKLEGNDTEVPRLIETETDMSATLWREVHEARRNREREVAPTEIEPEGDPNDFRYGALIITDIGPQKLKVVQILRRVLDVSPAETLALAAQHEIVVASGFLVRLHYLQEQLAALGASVEFRPDLESAI